MKIRHFFYVPCTEHTSSVSIFIKKKLKKQQYTHSVKPRFTFIHILVIQVPFAFQEYLHLKVLSDSTKRCANTSKYPNYLDLASAIPCFAFWLRNTSYKTCSSLHAVYPLLSNMRNDIHFCSFSNTTVIASFVQSFLMHILGSVPQGKSHFMFFGIVWEGNDWSLNSGCKSRKKSKGPVRRRVGGKVGGVRQASEYTSYQGRYIPFLFNLWVKLCIQLRFTIARRLTFMNFFVNQSSRKAFK